VKLPPDIERAIREANERMCREWGHDWYDQRGYRCGKQGCTYERVRICRRCDKVERP